MEKTIRVLVTGAGSGGGQAILKSLRISRLPLYIVCADIGCLNADLFKADHAVLIPKVECEGAIEAILEVIVNQKIDVVMIGSESEIEFFAEHAKHVCEKTGAVVISSPLETVQIGNDKWATYQFLKDNGFAYPTTYLPASYAEAVAITKANKAPMVLKGRHENSSKNVYIIEDQKQLGNVFKKVYEPILQELIALPSNSLGPEYTCSIFKTREGEIIGPFTARRTLRAESSWIVEVDKFQELEELLIGIGKKLPINGSLNVQIMLTDKGPIPFELNPHFSRTTAIRAHFGFNEPVMAIKNYFLNEKIENIKIGKGIVVRYLEEIFIDGLTVDDVNTPLVQGGMEAWS